MYESLKDWIAAIETLICAWYLTFMPMYLIHIIVHMTVDCFFILCKTEQALTFHRRYALRLMSIHHLMIVISCL